MNKLIALTFLLILAEINCYSQIKFEKGYLIDETNLKTECFIKNKDWAINPTKFEYKLTEESEVKQAQISQVKEFVIYNASKYIRALVEIDRSSNVTTNLSTEKNPVFQEELLFLKVLIEGKASLYQYNENGLNRYFYSKDGAAIKQLVYKQYLVNSSSFAVNELFKQQLYTDLNCQDISLPYFEGLDYDHRDLEKLLKKYNDCMKTEYVVYKPEKKIGLFNLNIRPGLNINSLKLGITDASATIYDYETISFPVSFNFRLGFEIEYKLPFNANKWSVIIEPTYKYIKTEDTWKTSLVAGGKLIANINYQTIDLPIGVRHYFHLGENSKVFINLSYILNFPINSSFDLTRTDGNPYNSKKIETSNNFAFGAGYKFKDKYMLEIRYETNRQLLNYYANWATEFTSFSFILGYTIF